MLKAVDEFSRERLAIRVGRRLKAGDVVDALADARRKIEVWRWDYNERRPHTSLGEFPAGTQRQPREFGG
jgi:transposase InsO family protein